MTRIVVWSFTLTSLLLGAVFVVLLVSVIRLRTDNTDARRATDLLAQSFVLERSVLDLETGLRAFLLTRHAPSPETYTLARERLPAQIDALRRLAHGADEQRSVGQISSAISSYIGHYASPLLAAGRPSANQIARVTMHGKTLVDGIRARLAAFDTRALALTRGRGLNANDGSAIALVAAGVGLVISLMLLVGQRIYLVLRILRPVRTVAEAAERLAQGHLDARVPEAGIGEVALLGDSFNQMAGAIQYRDGEISSARRQLGRAAAAAREASAMKSNFLANMSHEIRTPLNGVVGMVNLLAETEVTDEQRDYIDAAQSSSEALMTVVNDVLDIAKIEAGRLEIEQRDFDLHDMVESTCEMLSSSAVAKGLELQSFVHDDVPLTVRGDRMRVSQVLVNLLSNAVKFTAEGEVVVEASVARQAETIIEVKFEVRDTGIGIATEDVDRLFEPFSQADASTTRNFGGTGLGLAISAQLTRLMDGDIDAISVVGQGSTFWFTIPFEAAHAPLRVNAPVPVPSGLRVLVVDDNATNRRVFEAYLGSWQMRSGQARSGQEAILQLQTAAQESDPFDVALLDFNMPGETGLTLARRITSSPALRRTRLILLTSSGHSEAEAASTGICYQLTKPVRQSRLLDAITVAMALDSNDGEEPDRRPEHDHPSDYLPTTPSPSGGRILVAEDHHVNWMLVERMLAKRGHSAYNTKNGQSTIDALDRDRFDLVLMDCQMPNIDGYEATREIRRRETARGRGHVPIVAMTANAMMGDRDRCIAAGMDDYVAKPLLSDALDVVLARWLSPAAVAGVSLSRRRLGELQAMFPLKEMPQVLGELAADVRAQIERIDEALARDDRIAAAEAAHRITNDAHLLGAEALADAAIRLNRLGNEDHANGRAAIVEAMGAVRDLWEATRTAVDRELVEYGRDSAPTASESSVKRSRGV